MSKRFIPITIVFISILYSQLLSSGMDGEGLLTLLAEALYPVIAIYFIITIALLKRKRFAKKSFLTVHFLFSSPLLLFVFMSIMEAYNNVTLSTISGLTILLTLILPIRQYMNKSNCQDDNHHIHIKESSAIKIDKKKEEIFESEYRKMKGSGANMDEIAAQMIKDDLPSNLKEWILRKLFDLNLKNASEIIKKNEGQH